MPVNRHRSSPEPPTIASIWFGEEEITSMWTVFFQKRQRHPVQLILGTIQAWSKFNLLHKLRNLSSFAHVSAKNRATGSCARTNASSSRTVRRFPSPRTFQHSQLIVVGGAEGQPPPLEWGFHQREELQWLCVLWGSCTLERKVNFFYL